MTQQEMEAANMAINIEIKEMAKKYGDLIRDVRNEAQAQINALRREQEKAEMRYYMGICSLNDKGLIEREYMVENAKMKVEYLKLFSQCQQEINEIKARSQESISKLRDMEAKERIERKKKKYKELREWIAESIGRKAQDQQTQQDKQ